MVQLKIDTVHSSISFVVKHMMFAKARGTFGSWSGEINFDPENIASSSVNVTIDATSISTGEPNRDAHLKSPDFFGTETNPNFTFVSTSVEPDGDDFVVHGDFTMNGITKPVDLEVEYNGNGTSPMGTEVYSFSAEAKLNRKDFNVNWNAPVEAGGFLVGDDVKIEIEIEANPV
ncbi:MAG: YceI family protein [Thermomicrobiales bacterium]|nr:YceI family protein [Thermomicrobiales bacterium]